MNPDVAWIAVPRRALAATDIGKEWLAWQRL